MGNKRLNGGVRTACTARHVDRRSGTAAIELVLVLPILITIIGGAVDLGRIIEGDLKLSNAVRVGADYAGAHRYSEDQAAEWKDRVRDAVLLEAANLRHFDVGLLNVDIRPVVESDTHTTVTVSATYPMSMNLFWIGPGEHVTLRHSVSTRQIR
jgi:Flp pilus assembly protein TadG